MSLEDVYTLLELEDDPRVVTIHNMVEKRLMRRLNRRLNNVTSVPSDLDWIVTEITIARFNYIGSEGMTSESVEGHSANYWKDVFEPYEFDINDYIEDELEDDKPIQPRRGAAKFV